ncbi:MAG: creatinine amidohydrolase [Parasphingorhabdus sp.]|jgi:creatinine amidohydrolase
MQLTYSSWPQIEAYLKRCQGIVIPLGSTEQHGPTGFIGTDAICAESIAQLAAQDNESLLVAPTIAYTPAQFNLGFPGSVSVRGQTLIQLLDDIISSLMQGGFRYFYFLNGHGANIAPVRTLVHDIYQRLSTGKKYEQSVDFRIRSWWDFEAVNELRQSLYGDREGMHATPSEIAITLARKQTPGTDTTVSYSAISKEFLQQHAGDQHLDASRHRDQFPDGCVGSDPTLANQRDGKKLLHIAANCLQDDYLKFVGPGNQTEA